MSSSKRKSGSKRDEPKRRLSKVNYICLCALYLLAQQVSLSHCVSSNIRPSQASSANQNPAPGNQQQQQAQQLAGNGPISSGAQLFQSPAALAAVAAAAAAAAQSSSSSAAPVSAQPTLPSVLTARADSAAELLRQAAAQQGAAMQQVQQQPSAVPASAAGALIAAASAYNMEQECAISGGFISFELITGYVLGAPADSMQMQPGTLQLTDCLNLCRANASCSAINFETGLCVLLQESADKNPQNLQKSQFPVFTIYGHKICIQARVADLEEIIVREERNYPPQQQQQQQQQQHHDLDSSCQARRASGDRTNRCHKSWSFERVIGWVLNNLEKKTLLTKTRLECLLACYNEQTFQCKSFNYDSASGSCQLSDMDRHSLPNASMRRRHYVESTIDTIDYGENNCVQEARGICDFKPLQNRILKTVDSIYQDIKTEAECRKRCLQAPYRCHSYDLGDNSNPVCRTSHLDRNSLQQIQDPYLDIQGAVSYELDSCYNVTVVCKAREMVARVKTNKLFNGKIYAKNAPLSCMNDIKNSMDFELVMAFNDACSINKNVLPAGAASGQQGSQQQGVFTNEIVLQHNDMIVTNSDMGLNIKCQYDLRNQTVYNNINLDDFMLGREPIDIASQSAIVKSPNISMQILKHDGNMIQQAQVGDSLLLRFQITDERSPFEIFVRDLYAMDGVGGTEIMLVDGDGCPTDPSIMAAMTNAKGNGQTLEAQFDAFKFPTSETVAFRALVTPCIPHCEPVHCQNRVPDGTLYEAEAYGKRRRRKRQASPSESGAKSIGSSATGANQQPEEVVVRNSIEIKDKFFKGADEEAARQQASNRRANSETNPDWPMTSFVKIGGITFLFCALLVAQSVLFVGWAILWRRRYAGSVMSEKQQQLAQASSYAYQVGRHPRV